MTRLVFLALLLCCVSVSADEPEPAVGSEVLLIDAQRYFVIDIGGDAPTIREITDVWVTGTTPGNPPTPPTTKTIRQQLEEITAAVNDPLIEKALSEGVYATLKERLQAGTMTWQQCLSGIKLATDMVVGQSDKKPVWATWRTQFGAIIDKAQSEGQLTTKAQQVSFLGDVESVLSESSKNAAINFEMLLRLIRLILDLINTFFPQPPKAIEQPADPPQPIRLSPAAQKTGAIQPGDFRNFMNILYGIPIPAQPAVERKPVYTPARPIQTKFDADEARFGLVP